MITKSVHPSFVSHSSNSKTKLHRTVRSIVGFVLLAYLPLFFGLMLGCTQSSNRDPSKNATGESHSKPKTVATVGMVADLVRAIGGDEFEVQQLMGSGVDPHLYRATRDDSLAIRDAKAVFYCGLKLEGKMSDLLDKPNPRRPAVAVSSVLPREKILHPPDSDHADPHVWMDVQLWSDSAVAVEKVLAELKPDLQASLESRRKSLQERLIALDAFGARAIASIPESKRVMITSHDAFQYFGRRYGIEVMGIQGISTDSEAGLKRIRDLVTLIVDRKIEAVFVESSVPQDSVQALVRGAADRGHVVQVAGPLYSDAMGEQGTAEGTYEGMMKHNFITIAKSLGGNVTGLEDSNSEPAKGSP